MSTLPQFLKRKGYSILFNSDGEFVFYVPEQYFTSKNAIIVGEYVNIIGILDYTIFNKSGKHNGLKQFNFPTVFLTRPSTIEKIKDVKLTKYSEQQDYRLLKYIKGDEIVVSTKVPQNVTNVEDFYRLFLTGNLPTTIPHDDLQFYFTDSIALNGESYGVNLQLFGIVLGEMCRDSDNISIPYRLSKNAKSYTMINIRDVAKYISAHSAITSENWDEAVVSAIINKNTKDTPMEKLLMD